MSSTHIKSSTPTSPGFSFANNLSSLMLASPLCHRARVVQLKRASTSFSQKPISSTGKIRPPSIDMENINNANMRVHTTFETTEVHQNQTKFLTDSGVETLMTPRKELLMLLDKTESFQKSKVGYEEIVDQENTQGSIEDNLRGNLQYKIMENERLRVEISRLESELRTCKRNLRNATNSEEGQSPNQLNEKELRDILQSLSLLLKRSEEAYANIEKKCSKLDELINYIESGVLSTYKGLELKALTDTLKRVLEEFKPAAQLEIEVGNKTRELVKKKLDLAYLNTRYSKLSVKCEGIQNDLDVLRESLKAGHVERNVYVRSLTKEKTLNRENQRKLGDLQKTLEMLTEGSPPKQQRLPTLESDQSSMHFHLKESPSKTKDQTLTQRGVGEEKEYSITKLREALTKLVKENESLRRVIHVKNKDIEKLNDNLLKMTWKANKAMIRVEKLRNQKHATKMNDGTQDEEDLLVFYSNKRSMEVTKPASSVFLDTHRSLPKNLDFRFGLFEERYVDLINDVLEGGSQAFAEHIRMLSADEEIKAGVTLIANQFISYRNFAEKMNRLMTECFHLFSLKTFNQVMMHINTSVVKQILGAGTVRLWINEPMLGTYRTMESSEKELKCMVNKGLIAEVVRSSSRVLKRSQEEKYAVLEYIHNDGTSSVEKASTVLLMPLKIKNDQIIGILEISKFNYETFLMDLDYFAQMLSELCVILWDRTNRERVITTDLKHKEMYFDAFADLASSISQREFCEKVEKWVPKVFQSSGARYVLVHNSVLIRFKKNGGSESFNENNGIIGRVATQRKPYTLLDVTGSTMHSENIDINTTFPLYTTPVILKKRHRDRRDDDVTVIGVLQVVLSHKSALRETGTEEPILNHIKALDPNLENLISKFTKLIAIAYDVMGQRERDADIIEEAKTKTNIENLTKRR